MAPKDPKDKAPPVAPASKGKLNQEHPDGPDATETLPYDETPRATPWEDEDRDTLPVGDIEAPDEDSLNRYSTEDPTQIDMPRFEEQRRSLEGDEEPGGFDSLVDPDEQSDYDMGRLVRPSRLEMFVDDDDMDPTLMDIGEVAGDEGESFGESEEDDDGPAPAGESGDMFDEKASADGLELLQQAMEQGLVTEQETTPGQESRMSQRQQYNATLLIQTVTAVFYNAPNLELGNKSRLWEISTSFSYDEQATNTWFAVNSKPFLVSMRMNYDGDRWTALNVGVVFEAEGMAERMLLPANVTKHQASKRESGVMSFYASWEHDLGAGDQGMQDSARQAAGRFVLTMFDFALSQGLRTGKLSEETCLDDKFDIGDRYVTMQFLRDWEP